MDYALIIIVSVILSNIIFILLIPKKYHINDLSTIESYTPYSYDPFNYMDTGADPLTFYKYPIYKKPYMFPYKFYSSYPYPYMSYYETNI